MKGLLLVHNGRKNIAHHKHLLLVGRIEIEIVKKLLINLGKKIDELVEIPIQIRIAGNLGRHHL